MPKDEIPMKSVQPNEKHKAFREELMEVCKKHTGDDLLTGEDILAVVSQCVGQLIALQDQRKYTPDIVMKIVSDNIEMGNAQAIEKLLGKTEGQA